MLRKRTGIVVFAAVLAGAGGVILMGGMRAVLSAPAKSGGWVTYKDAQRGFTVTQPAGWMVRADSRSILVQDPSRRETVQMEVFTATPGKSAASHLRGLPEAQSALFPDAQVGAITPRKTKGDEAAGTLTYGGGAGSGRALCSITGGKGLLFVLAAPAGNFAAEQPTLTRIVKSLRFMAPAAGAKSASAGAAAAVRGLRFIPWTDPREHGFQIEVPVGWKTEGGAFSVGPTDLRIAYDVTSPGKDMQVVIGDPRLPSTIITPNEMLGAFDGQNGCLHYMEATEFNHSYLNTLGRQSLDNLVIGADHPLLEVSRQRTVQAQQMFGPSAEVDVNVGITEFSGLSKLTHKQIIGVVIGSTQRMTSHGIRADTTLWAPNTVVLSCNDDAKKTRNQQIVMAVFARVQQSYHENSAWVRRHAQAGAATGDAIRHKMQQDTQERIDQSKQISAEITQSSDAARKSSMGAYWGHVNADNERQRGFVNWMGDRTDVGGDGGATVNVPGGSKHYYRNGQTGDVLGTDSAYSPGVDFAPLTEK